MVNSTNYSKQSSESTDYKRKNEGGFVLLLEGGGTLLLEGQNAGILLMGDRIDSTNYSKITINKTNYA